MQNTTLKITGMTCNHCKARVEKALGGLDGVDSAVVDLSAGTAQVSYDESRVDTKKMAEAVTDAGYTVEQG